MTLPGFRGLLNYATYVNIDHVSELLARVSCSSYRGHVTVGTTSRMIGYDDRGQRRPRWMLLFILTR